jgi:hypothetical protein
VLASHLVIRHTRVAERKLGLFSSRFERDQDYGLDTQVYSTRWGRSEESTRNDFAPLQRPEQFNRVVLAFLDKVLS